MDTLRLVLTIADQQPALYALPGLLLGALSCWLVMRLSHGRTVALLRDDLEEAVDQASDLGDKLDRLQSRLEQEIAERASASATATGLKDELDRVHSKLQSVSQDRDRLATSQADLKARFQEAKQTIEQSRALYAEMEKGLKQAFTSVSSQVLEQSNTAFLKLAKESFAAQLTQGRSDLDKREQSIASLVKPINSSLDKVSQALGEIEKERHGQYRSLQDHLNMMHELHVSLHKETRNLTQALRKPQVRGHWGEFQLKRVCELAGMLDHCDFYEQQSADSDEGRLRPDLIVRLPGGKQIIVDAKAPVQNYLDSVESDDEAKRQEHLDRHARAVRSRMSELKSKRYWSQFADTPEFVVMFLPGEAFYQAALSRDPGLIETGFENRVLLASPTSLLALLRAAAYGWQQERIAANARHIQDLGRELAERVSAFTTHLAKLGRQLTTAVGTYNQAVGSLESRVLVTVRRFDELGISAPGAIEELKPIDTAARRIEEKDEGKEEA